MSFGVLGHSPKENLGFFTSTLSLHSSLRKNKTQTTNNEVFSHFTSLWDWCSLIRCERKRLREDSAGWIWNAPFTQLVYQVLYFWWLSEETPLPLPSPLYFVHQWKTFCALSLSSIVSSFLSLFLSSSNALSCRCPIGFAKVLFGPSNHEASNTRGLVRKV